MLILIYNRIIDFLRHVKILKHKLNFNIFACLESPLYDYKLKLTFYFSQCNIRREEH